MDKTASVSGYATAICFLSKCLENYHGKKAVVLIDEYDVPLENAYFNGFYRQMSTFSRSLVESALKTNESLEFAVITGCLRISKESIFTGLNNLKAVSVLDESYAEYFGFTQEEVDRLLEDYEIAYKKEEVKRWYDGYVFGNTEVYNPWSVINYASDIVQKNTEFPKPYWSNTFSNSIVRELVENADEAARGELEELVDKGLRMSIFFPLHVTITSRRSRNC